MHRARGITIRRVELRQLQHFLAVIETRSFSRAAERLGLSQQAISKSVRSLESDIGAALLDRHAQPLAPTAIGRLLAARASTINGEIQAFEDRLRARADTRIRRIRIGTSPTATPAIVTPAVLSATRQQPGLRIDVAAGLRRDLLPQVEQGALDLAVCLDIEERHGRRLAREVLCHDEYAVVAGRRNPLGRRDDLQAAELADVPWILGRNLGDIAAAWAAVWAAAGRTAPLPSIETTSLEFCRLALRDSPYVTILPRSLIAGDVAARRLQIIPVVDFAWRRPIALYYRRRPAPAGDAELLISALRAAAADWLD